MTIKHQNRTWGYFLYKMMGVFLFVGTVSLLSYWAAVVYADTTSTNLTQTITAGTLSIDIVNAVYAVVGSPAVAMGSVTFSFACQDATGTLGTTSEQIYVSNPDAADGGWSVTIAGSSPTAVWDSAGVDYDFNEAGTGGCADDGATTDADALGGQLKVDPSAGTLAAGECLTCTTANIGLGASSSFVQTSNNTITILTGASNSDEIGDWTLQDVTLTQKIPSEQPAAADYDISMTLTATAT